MNHVEYTMARSRYKFDDQEAYMATAYSLRDRLIESWNDTQAYFKCAAGMAAPLWKRGDALSRRASCTVLPAGAAPVASRGAWCPVWVVGSDARCTVLHMMRCAARDAR